MVRCQQVMDIMEHIAPRHLAEEWDNPGLLVGSPGQEVHGMIVCLDVSEAVVDYAIKNGIDMIIAHHPLIFKPCREVRTDRPQGKLLQKLLAHGMAVFAAHTNLDIAAGGVNDVLAAAIGLSNLQPFAERATGQLEKLAVYVPSGQAEAVREAIMQAGAGWIGKYSCCTFNVKGQGTFCPLDGTHPFIGTKGQLSTVDEVRIETILPVEIEDRVVQAMLQAHPYEEAAYDLYPLRNPGQVQGLGRIGSLLEPVSPREFAEQVRKGLHADYVRLVQAGDQLVQKVALCSGSGAEFIGRAAGLGADAYVTGDVRYHEAQQAVQQGLHVIDAGHFSTEFPIVEVLARRLEAELQGQVKIAVDDFSQDFFQIIR